MKDEEEKIITMQCDHCKHDFNCKEMYFFQTHNPQIYNQYHHLCESCYDICTKNSQ